MSGSGSREMDTGAQLTISFLCILDPSPWNNGAAIVIIGLLITSQCRNFLMEFVKLTVSTNYHKWKPLRVVKIGHSKFLWLGGFPVSK